MRVYRDNLWQTWESTGIFTFAVLGDPEPYLEVILELGVALVRPRKSSRFHCISKTPTNQLIGLQGRPKVTEMKSQRVPDVT